MNKAEFVIMLLCVIAVGIALFLLLGTGAFIIQTLFAIFTNAY